MFDFMYFGHSLDEDAPTPEQIPNWRRRMDPPENEVPGAVPWSAILGYSTDLAVALVGARAYSTGIQLEVAVRARQKSRRGSEDLYDEISGYPPVGVDRLLLDVEYADGRVATNATNAAQDGWPYQEPPDDEPSLHPRSSSSSRRGIDVEFFLSPLPPAGPLAIVCAWPHRGIPETRTALDGAALTEAVKQIQVLWPTEVEPPPEPAPPPDVPRGGWFEAVLQPDPR